MKTYAEVTSRNILLFLKNMERRSILQRAVYKETGSQQTKMFCVGSNTQPRVSTEFRQSSQVIKLFVFQSQPKHTTTIYFWCLETGTQQQKQKEQQDSKEQK
jgi:hypothetical protein